MGSSSSAATANIRRFCALARNAPGGAIGFEAVQGGEDTQATAPGFPEINLRFFGSHHNSSGCRTRPRGNWPADPAPPALSLETRIQRSQWASWWVIVEGPWQMPKRRCVPIAAIDK